jgi:hypothetical protein
MSQYPRGGNSCGGVSDGIPIERTASGKVAKSLEGGLEASLDSPSLAVG